MTLVAFNMSLLNTAEEMSNGLVVTSDSNENLTEGRSRQRR